MNDYEVLKQINENTTISRRIRDGRKFVIESVHYAGLSKEMKEKLIQRINFLIQYTRNEPNIARYHNAFIEGTSILVPSDYTGDVTLETKLKEAMKAKVPMPEDFIWNVVTNIALSLVSFHTNKSQTGHGQITAKNIHFDDDNNVMLTGFLLAPSTMEPQEMIENDLYKIGSLMYEMGTLSRFDLNSRHFKAHIERLSSGMQRVIMALTTKIEDQEPMTITSLLSVPEIAIIVLEKKLKREKDIYEATKRKVIELEAEVELRKKRKMQQDSEPQSPEII